MNFENFREIKSCIWILKNPLIKLNLRKKKVNLGGREREKNREVEKRVEEEKREKETMMKF